MDGISTGKYRIYLRTILRQHYYAASLDGFSDLIQCDPVQGQNDI